MISLDDYDMTSAIRIKRGNEPLFLVNVHLYSFVGSELTPALSRNTWMGLWANTWLENVPAEARGPGHIPRHRPPTRLVPSTLFRFEVEEKLSLVSVIAESLRVACVRNCIDDPRDDVPASLIDRRKGCIRACKILYQETHLWTLWCIYL